MPTMADDDRFFSKYNDLISEAIDQYHVPGISVAVVHGLSTFTKVRRLVNLCLSIPSEHGQGVRICEVAQ